MSLTFGNGIGENTLGFEDTKDLVTSDKAHLRDAMGVTESNTDLGGGKTLTGELYNLLSDFFRCRLEP